MAAEGAAGRTGLQVSAVAAAITMQTSTVSRSQCAPRTQGSRGDSFGNSSFRTANMRFLITIARSPVLGYVA